MWLVCNKMGSACAILKLGSRCLPLREDLQPLSIPYRQVWIQWSPPEAVRFSRFGNQDWMHVACHWDKHRLYISVIRPPNKKFWSSQIWSWRWGLCIFDINLQGKAGTLLVIWLLLNYALWFTVLYIAGWWNFHWQTGNAKVWCMPVLCFVFWRGICLLCKFCTTEFPRLVQ